QLREPITRQGFPQLRQRHLDAHHHRIREKTISERTTALPEQGHLQRHESAAQAASTHFATNVAVSKFLELVPRATDLDAVTGPACPRAGVPLIVWQLARWSIKYPGVGFR
ncbi:MAG: hypothetical protein ACRDTT_03535, partial [Pseudonocardiaceae bacterium]